MRLLTQEEFRKLNFSEIAKHHGMGEMEFIRRVFPAERNIWQSVMFYTTYKQWYNLTYNKLAKALK